MDNFKKFDIDYSLKNIPVPNKDVYLKSLIHECEKFIQRIRWRAHFALQENRPTQRETFGFKTPHNAPVCPHLINFENDLTHLISNLEFRTVNTAFQNKLRADVKKIEKSDKIFAKADKTNNVYEIPKQHYEKLLRDSVTSHYERTDESDVKTINLEAKDITTKLDISDRVQPIAQAPAFVTIKDHKDDFPRNAKCRLINPAKSNVGIISKQLLENINKQLRDDLNLNQWRSTHEVIDWFKNIQNKTRLNFLQLDICEYYPSISKELFLTALNFASEHVEISNLDKQILLNARQSLLFSNGKVWKKKTGLFDTTMGAYDGCEVCELVGLLILNKMKTNFPNLNFGLYRDDGLGVHKRISTTELNATVKAIKDLFLNLGLKITIETRMTEVNFLDVNFNLHKEIFKPYRKPNDSTVYVHSQSNHPKSVLKQIPNSVNTRLSAISSNEQVFNETKETYTKALRRSGHQANLTYINNQNNQESTNRRRRRQRREITYFNPPYSNSLKTNLGKEFLKLIDKNFPVNNILHHIINRHTVKISYSCTQSIGQILQKHNKKLLKPQTPVPDNPAAKLCNCRNSVCPVEGKCLEESVIYQATLESPNGTKAEYIGVTDSQFKTRYNNHTHSFRASYKKNSTTLSTRVWQLNLNPNPNIRWKIIRKCPKFKPGMKTCHLCLGEKFEILKNINNPRHLNKRTDIGMKCTLHTKPQMLKEYN